MKTTDETRQDLNKKSVSELIDIIIEIQILTECGKNAFDPEKAISIKEYCEGVTYAYNCVQKVINR
jgi:hypothetical protein